jgi:putative glutamine amidotransferase
MRSDKPIIGITLSETKGVDPKRWPTRRPFDYLKQEYSRAIHLSGGIPFLLSNIDDQSVVADIIQSIDGLLLTGGGDMHPLRYGERPHPALGETTETRDAFEMTLVVEALKFNKPILGICRGHQALNVALGGTLYQDLTCYPKKTRDGGHADPGQTFNLFHETYITPASKLHKIIGSERIETNSSHHQLVNKLGQGLKVTAICVDDQVPEAIEHSGFDFVIGVQWHPEAIFDREHSKKLFSAFVEAAGQT